MKLNILIFEKSTFYREVISSAISECPEIEVVSISGSEDIIYKALNDHEIDVLLTRFSEFENAKFLYVLSKINPNLKVLGIVLPEKDFTGRGLIQISNQLYLSKYNADSDDLLTEMRQICMKNGTSQLLHGQVKQQFLQGEA